MLSDSGDSRLKLFQLRALVAVARLGNFSEAAHQLGLSQSAVSHAIATLEDELGVVLMLRGRRGAALTPVGERICEDAQEILRLVESIREKSQQERQFDKGQVRVASVRSIATHVLPEVIAQFRQRFPGITVALEECDRYVEVEQRLKDGQTDVGLLFVPTLPELEARELFRDEFVALLPPGTLPESEPLTWELLLSQPMIVNLRSVKHNELIFTHLKSFGFTPTVAYEVREDSTILGMVKQGLGVSVMARMSAEPIPPDIQVRELPVPLERVIGVAVMANTLLPQAVLAFFDSLKPGDRSN